MSILQHLSIRPARTADAEALHVLCALDEAELGAGRVLVAEVDGTLHAALNVDRGTHAADPFRRTAELLDLLRFRARQVAVPT